MRHLMAEPRLLRHLPATSARTNSHAESTRRPALRNSVGSVTLYDGEKRLLDLVVCLMALPFALAVLAICALAIKIDSPGPVFFFQLRTGRGGHRFRMFKLRTMRADAEKLKEQYAHLNLLTYPDFKIFNDPRITRI